MVRSLRIYLFIAFLAAALAARSQTTREREPGSLAGELEGLAPGPRIAYLEYLLKSGTRDAEVYFQLGVAFYDAERSDSAMFYYAKAAELDSHLSKAYVNMGVILDGQHRSREAIEMFDKAAEANPLDVLAHAHAADLLFSAGEYEAAWSRLSRALAIDSLHPQPHFYLGIFFWESGMFRESLVEWERVVELAPASRLAGKARENIAVLQDALWGPGGERAPLPRR